MRFIVACLFFIQSGESIYDPPWFGFTIVLFCFPIDSVLFLSLLLSDSI